MSESNTFDLALKAAVTMPEVRISREKFLWDSLGELCSERTVEEAVHTMPAAAGVSKKAVERAARAAVAYESSRVSTLKFSAGLPAGLSMLGMVPADVTRYMAHALRITQKLSFLYGWKELLGGGELEEGASALFTLSFGVMLDVDGAAEALRALSAPLPLDAETAAEGVRIHGLRFTIGQVSQILSRRMPREVYGKRVSRFIPIVGGVDPGAYTYVTYKPMADRLRLFFADLPWQGAEE